jgi:hypothetical protein
LERYELQAGFNQADVPDRYKQYQGALDKGGPMGYWLARGPTSDEEAFPLLLPTAYNQAERFSRLGDRAQALLWLERAVPKRLLMEDLLLDEFWDDYRNEPKFKEMLTAVHLDPWAR